MNAPHQKFDDALADKRLQGAIQSATGRMVVGRKTPSPSFPIIRSCGSRPTKSKSTRSITSIIIWKSWSAT